MSALFAVQGQSCALSADQLADLASTIRLHATTETITHDPAVPAITEELIFEVVKVTGMGFGDVSNVLFAARNALVEAHAAKAVAPAGHLTLVNDGPHAGI